MYNFLEKLEALKAKMNSKTQCIAISYDNGDCDDEGKTLIYKSDRIDEYGDLIVKAMDGRHLQVLDQNEIENYVNNIFLIKKSLKNKLDKVSSYKSPTNSRRHVGIELEFISRLSKSDLSIAICEAGIEKYITIKDDGSIDTEEDYEYSHEVCILASENEYERVVNKFCKIVSRTSKVNKSCGMHVHLDMRTRNVDMAYAALFEAQPVLYAMCPKSRRTGTYSKITESFNMVSLRRDINDDRYFGINKMAYLSHKTIEVRVHSGTLISTKINSWVKLLLKIIDNKKIYDLDLVRPLSSLSQFKKQTKIRGRLAKYVEERIEEFKRQQNGTNLPLGA